jgi:opacity protein-like surface antigen
VSRSFLAAALVAVATALPAAASAPQSPIVPRLSAKVTSSTISLRNAAGVRIKSIPQNTYKIMVSDATTAQNFHLIGPAVNRKTGVAARAKTSWSLELTPGKYVYRSDKNTKLRGSFTVTSVPPA